MLFRSTGYQYVEIFEFLKDPDVAPLAVLTAVPTRWFSELTMITRLLKLKSAVLVLSETLAEYDETKDVVPVPSAAEWKLAVWLRDTFTPLHDVCTKLEPSHHVTISLVCFCSFSLDALVQIIPHVSKEIERLRELHSKESKDSELRT